MDIPISRAIAPSIMNAFMYSRIEREIYQHLFKWILNLSTDSLTMRIATNTPIDKILSGGVEDDAITNFYGPAGSGKTNVAICSAIAAVKAGKRVIYVDTEGSFSGERFVQLGGNDEILKSILFVEPTSWKQQHAEIQRLEKSAEGAGLIIVDSMVTLYRLELSDDNFHLVNRQLATQYSVLCKIARTMKIPVIITNQVYSMRDGNTERVELTSRTISKYWSRALIELKKTEASGHRIAIVRKHRSIAEGKSVEFEIKEKELKEVKLLGIL